MGKGEHGLFKGVMSCLRCMLDVKGCRRCNKGVQGLIRVSMGCLRVSKGVYELSRVRTSCQWV